MNLKDIKRMSQMAAKAGYEIHALDYGWSVHAYNKRTKRSLIISEVFRPERDGYSGGKLIAEDMLREYLKENPA